jgi:hypothetical protein
MPVEIEDMNVDVTPATHSASAPAVASTPAPDEPRREREIVALLAEHEWQRARLMAD